MQYTRPTRLRFQIYPALLIIAVWICIAESGRSQCFNTFQYPASDVQVTPFSGVIDTISLESQAGHYCVLNNLEVGKDYTFSSSAPNDFITVRINGGTAGDPPVSSGPAPHTFTATSHILEVHINLVSPPCGTENSFRITTINCVTCSSVPTGVGVNNTDPMATLDVNGNLRIKDTPGSPAAGMIRFNSATNDFEGFNGQKWLSLTKSASRWGRVPVADAVEDHVMTAIDGAANDLFGNSVSISGDYAVIGAPLADLGSNTNQGAAYIFVRSGTTWTQQAKLIAADGAAGDLFGGSVSISGDYAVIGASSANIGSNVDQGAAYIFLRSGTTWTQQAKLTASDGSQSDFFGLSVSISGDDVVVGTASADIGSNVGQGAAYIFVRSGTTWTEQAKLTAADGDQSDFFGVSVSISNDDVVIGAFETDIGSNIDQGAAYIFVRSGTTWTEQAKLTASDGGAIDRFGESVCISGDEVVVASRYADIGSNPDQGAAYVFVRSGTTWTQEAKLTAGDGADGDEFGSSVCISGDNVVVSAWHADIGSNPDQGATYIFGRSGTTWAQQAKLTASEGAQDDEFGFSASISDDDVVVGAQRADLGSNVDQGAAYFFCRK